MAKKSKKKAAKPAPKQVTKKVAKKTAKKVAAKSMTKVVKKPSAKTGASKKKSSKPAKAVKAAAPKGHALMSVAPGLTSNDAAASIKWYCEVLGFHVIEKWEHEGQFLGAQIGSGTVTMNVGQDDWKMGRDRVKGQGTRMYIMTGPEIDKLANNIKANGGTLDSEPADVWGMRAFSVTDPDGFKITFMTMLKK
jgi:uncharacterized glyoxalase superfamily protein PhnB